MCQYVVALFTLIVAFWDIVRPKLEADRLLVCQKLIEESGHQPILFLTLITHYDKEENALKMLFFSVEYFRRRAISVPVEIQ